MYFKKDDKEREHAALIIQAGARRFLLRRQTARAPWARTVAAESAAAAHLSDSRLKRCRDEIELWQQKNKVGPLTATELQVWN